jgi:hypothetical protein
MDFRGSPHAGKFYAGCVNLPALQRPGMTQKESAVTKDLHFCYIFSFDLFF